MSHKHNNNPFKNNDEDNKIEEQIKESLEQAEGNKPVEETKIETGDSAELDKLKEDFDKLNNQYLRLAADFDNYRKRQEQEREALLKFGTENALKKLIEVLDNFERGAKSLENVEDCQKVKDSFNLVHKQTEDALAKLGLEEIHAEGEEFDPNFHEAIMQTPTSEHAENTVIGVMQKGYRMGDKVLRPALVNVASAE